jgi:hypothetical protein
VVDENYEEVEDYDDVDHSGEFEFFIGDENGKPTKDVNQYEK